VAWLAEARKHGRRRSNRPPPAQRKTCRKIRVRPTQLAGIEINPYAQQLAQVVIWIGYLQWMHHNGFVGPRNPVLEPIENIHRMDAIIDITDPMNPKEPEWPRAEFIVGNPPFLGNKRMREELGSSYVEPLWKLFRDRLPPMSDLCCYWFEKARSLVQDGKCRAAGLLATTGIRQVGARHVVERIKDPCKLSFAVSDREWILEGASVRISIIGFVHKNEPGLPVLDGRAVTEINADLSSGLDLTQAVVLSQNKGLCFMGITKVGDFDVDHGTALSFLQATNPDGKPNCDVVRPIRNGSDIMRKCSN
jgi:hypothetical protein